MIILLLEANDPECYIQDRPKNNKEAVTSPDIIDSTGSTVIIMTVNFRVDFFILGTLYRCIRLLFD
jgi:hypothetical protein